MGERRGVTTYVDAATSTIDSDRKYQRNHSCVLSRDTSTHGLSDGTCIFVYYAVLFCRGPLPPSGPGPWMMAPSSLPLPHRDSTVETRCFLLPPLYSGTSSASSFILFVSRSFLPHLPLLTLPHPTRCSDAVTPPPSSAHHHARLTGELVTIVSQGGPMSPFSSPSHVLALLSL